MNCRSARASTAGARGNKADRRLAVEWNRDAAERVPIHPADWLEPLRRWRYQKSRPAFVESCLYRAGAASESEPVVQSERVHSADCGHVRESGQGDAHRAGLGRGGFVTVQEYRGIREGQLAIPSGVFQRAEPRELRHAERDRVCERRDQPIGGIDHCYGHYVPADSIRIEADFLTADWE